jgi:cysteine-rich repeat protein
VESFSFDAQQGMVYYVFVDGRDQTDGDYVLTASLQPGACGDHVINAPAEDCDFGDTNPGDGCDPNCQFEPPADLSDICPGALYQVMPNTPFTITSFTTGYTDNYTSCGAAMGAPDRVFALFANGAGTLTVTLPNLGAAGGGFDGVLAAWSTTCSPGNMSMPPYLGCSDGALASDTEQMSFPVTAGGIYFVVVDGYANYSYGNFQLTVSLQ